MVERVYRKYFGKSFYKQKDGYWVNFMPIQAHRWVWINHHGTIPKGMDIHHKDGDKDNNEIENLQMLSRSEHLKEHWKDPELRKERRKQLDILRKQVHEWLRSPEGRKKQSESSKKAWEKRRKDLICCIECGKEIITTQPWTKFCDGSCSMRWRRKHKPNLIEEICPVCHKIFSKEKFTPKRFCSISCGAKNSASNRSNKSK